MTVSEKLQKMRVRRDELSKEIEFLDSASKIFFGAPLSGFNRQQLVRIFEGFPCYAVNAEKIKLSGFTVNDLLSQLNWNMESLSGKNIYINNELVEGETVLTECALLDNRIIIVRIGKNDFHMIEFYGGLQNDN